VTGGSRVVAGIDTLWLSSGVRAGAILMFDGMVGGLTIARVVNDEELHLSMPPEGLTVGESMRIESYTISSDFTPHLAIPYSNDGEIDHASLMRRAAELIDKIIPQT
jgi:hypothetical protein